MKNKILIALLLATLWACTPNTKEKRQTKQNENYRPTTAEPVAGKFLKEGLITITPPADSTPLAILEVEVANTPQRRQKGLMHRQQLAGNQGMFFIFEQAAWQSFWMKNTFIPLDIVFISDSYSIINIHHNTQPFSEQSYPSKGAARYVLEVNGGYCKANNITAGCKVIFTPMPAS